jgi:4'-phosphopantetheinyl transferase
MTRIAEGEPGPVSPALAPGDFHLWRVPCMPEYADKLVGRERTRYRRMTHPEARLDYAASQAGLREVLARYLICPAENVILRRHERGKPFLEDGPEFNLSHSGGCVLLAVSPHPVGLDVEKETRVVRHDGLAAKFFSKSEQKRIADFAPGERNGLFLRHWVCKEAVVKLSGDGIFRGLRDVEICLEGPQGARGCFRGREVFLQEIRPAKGFLAALASWQPLRLQGKFLL